MIFEIEKNIPLQDSQSRKKYPFDEMDVDDSFFIPNGLKSTVYSSVSIKNGNGDKKFTCRKVEGGIRVWRIK